MKIGFLKGKLMGGGNITLIKHQKSTRATKSRHPNNKYKPKRQKKQEQASTDKQGKTTTTLIN